MGQCSKKSDADKEKPVRKEEKSRIKDKGSDFWLLYMTLNSSGTVVGRERVWPQYFHIPATLGSNTLNVQPGGDISKGRVASTIWDMPKGL